MQGLPGRRPVLLCPGPRGLERVSAAVGPLRALAGSWPRRIAGGPLPVEPPRLSAVSEDFVSMWFLRQQCLPGRSCSTSRLDSIMPEALRGCGIGLFEALGEVFQGSRVPSLEDPAPDLLSFLAAVRP